MHLWRKLAEPRWLSVYEKTLQAHAHGRLVIVSKPGRKRLQLEIACRSRKGGTTRCDSFSQDVKSSTAHGDSPRRSLRVDRGGVEARRQGQRKSLPPTASAFRHDRYEGQLRVKLAGAVDN